MSADIDRDRRFHDATLRQRLGTPTKVISNARGEIVLWVVPRRGIVVTVARGHGSTEFAAPLIETIDSAVSQGVREFWDDWADVTSYDSPLRVQLTEWTKARPSIAAGLHILVGSKLIAMGVNLSNLALGNTFEVTSDRAQFERGRRARLGT